MTEQELERLADAKAAEMAGRVEITKLCEITNFSHTTLKRMLANAFVEGALAHKKSLEAVK